MSEPRTTVPPESDPEIPNWMQSVDREAFYNADPSASPEEDAASPAGPPVAPSNGSAKAPASSASETEAAAPSGPPSSSATREATESSTSASPSAPSLSQKLHLALGDTEELPVPNPALQPVSAGSVRADLKRHLEQAVAVLSTRYTSVVSTSLVLEFALHRTLLELQDHDTDSALVEWLDTKLSRKGR